MDDFMLYLEMGLYHVMDLKAYDHVLFLIVLAVVFSFTQLKKLFVVGNTFYNWSFSFIVVISI